MHDPIIMPPIVTAQDAWSSVMFLELRAVREEISALRDDLKRTPLPPPSPAKAGAQGGARPTSTSPSPAARGGTPR